MSDRADDIATLTLGQRLPTAEAAALHARLAALRDRPLTVDASAVNMLGALCLQVLLAAARDWQRRGLGFAVVPRSAAFARALAGFGASLPGADGR